MAGLRERREHDAAWLWSVVTWRLMPFFAACVAALALWQAQLSTESNEAALAAGWNSPEAAEIGGN